MFPITLLPFFIAAEAETEAEAVAEADAKAVAEAEAAALLRGVSLAKVIVKRR